MDKVVIVGAGPAGLFAANELVSDYEVVVVEQRPRAGGAGLQSDGKLNIHPRIGGDLSCFESVIDPWTLMKEIRSIFLRYGAPDTGGVDLERLNPLKRIALSNGLDFLGYETIHVGTDLLPELIDRFVEDLRSRGVEFQFNTRAVDVAERFAPYLKRLIVDKDGETNEITGDYFILAPGRNGSKWMRKLANDHRLETRSHPIDIGIRIEVPRDITDYLLEEHRCVDFKVWYHSKLTDNRVRTFCMCHGGKVVPERYMERLYGVNGQSDSRQQYPNTNFALLVTIGLIEPYEDTHEYGNSITRSVNILGGGKPIVQRLRDLKDQQRTDRERLIKSSVTPSFEGAVPGDINLGYPARVVSNLLETLERLDHVIPGVNQGNSVLLYAPEVKFYASQIVTNQHLLVMGYHNLYVAGDGSGRSRDITHAAATGIIAARGIKWG